jgi:hypothetical protein
MPGPLAEEERTVNDNSRSRAKGGTRNARSGTQQAKAGTRNAQAGSQQAKTDAQNTKAAAPRTKAATRNAQAATQNAQGGTRDAQGDTGNRRLWFGPKGPGLGYRPRTWQGYVVMLVLGAYAIFIGTLSADHHSPLILLAIAPAALVPRLIALIQQR